MERKLPKEGTRGRSLSTEFSEAARRFNEGHGRTLEELGLDAKMIRMATNPLGSKGQIAEALVRLVRAHKLETGLPITNEELAEKCLAAGIVSETGASTQLSQYIKPLVNSGVVTGSLKRDIHSQFLK